MMKKATVTVSAQRVLWRSLWCVPHRSWWWSIRATFHFPTKHSNFLHLPKTARQIGRGGKVRVPYLTLYEFVPNVAMIITTLTFYSLTIMIIGLSSQSRTNLKLPLSLRLPKLAFVMFEHGACRVFCIFH